MTLGDNWGVKIYDITLPIKNKMLVWPGDPPVSITIRKTVSKDSVGLSHFSFGSHTGTHIDAPSHFLEKAKSVDGIDPRKLIGECHVIDLVKTKHREISPADLRQASIKRGSRLLFKTSSFRLLKKKSFSSNYVSLSLEAAKYLAQKKIYLVGTDFLGIEKKGNPGHPVHKTLLAAGIVIVEGLDLGAVPAGEYQIYCLPLKVVGADGAPARIILVKSENL